MGHFTDFLPVWEVFKTDIEGAEIAVNIYKMTLGEVLTYLCVKNNLVAVSVLKLPETELLSELAAILTHHKTHSGLPEETIREIVSRGEALNFPPAEKAHGAGEKASPEWVAQLIAKLGVLGYKRDDVLALYPAEIPALLREARRETIRTAICIAQAINAPGTLFDDLKTLESPEERNEVSMETYKALEKKYLKKGKK